MPVHRRTVHRTHGEVIGVRARRDHLALRPIPSKPYLVTDRHLRHVAKDCLVAFEANLYSVPATRVFHRQMVEVRASSATVSLHATVPDENGITLLAVHPRATGRGNRVVDPEHWCGLPDGHTRAITTGHDPADPGDQLAARRRRHHKQGALGFLLARSDAAGVEVGRRSPAVYDQITGTGPFT
ncbi:Mu transposase domain-containing protein [Actinomadura coerulea]|uniref:Mu transposase domain-containing protein n=1 Tax=Actinomadura coerulea TaxID=46159 RepID=UPI0034347B70